MTDKLEIPRDAILNGSNYPDWKFTVTAILEQHKLDDFVIHGIQPVDDNKLRNANTFMIFALDSEHRKKISHCLDAHEMWICIKGIYENTSKRATSALCRRLMTFQINSIDDVAKGISDIQGIASALKVRGVQLHDTLIIGAIENALPKCFQHWLEIWSMRDSEPSINELLSSINNYSETLRSTEAKAFVANSHPRDAATNSKCQPKSSAPKVCKYCKKKGHTISECRKFKWKKEQEAKAEENTKSNKPEPVAFMALSEGQSVNTNWLADSGCSLHMTPNRHFISNYTPLVTALNIRLGDNSSIQALGYGTVYTASSVWFG
mgnify:CR=1 FL=1